MQACRLLLLAPLAACGSGPKLTTGLDTTVTAPFDEGGEDPPNEPDPTGNGSGRPTTSGGVSATGGGATTTSGDPDSGEPGTTVTTTNPGTSMTTMDTSSTTTTTEPDTTEGPACEGRDDALAACGDGASAHQGDVAEDALRLVEGAIAQVADGPDWYSVDFPEAQAQGVRPNAGSIRVDFASNPGEAYRLDVYRSCGGAAFADELAAQFGAGAPPAREWMFFDDHPAPGNANWKNDVAWPERVYLRITRVAEGDPCAGYSLRIRRDPS